jgi:hypothetical protein
MKKYFILMLPLLFATSLQAQVSIDYYLPEGTQYNPDIPTPEAVLGFQVGEWHVRHDQLVHYAKTLAELSDRVTIESHHRTHENREGVLLTITSPENHGNLAELKSQHVQLTNPAESDQLDISTMPVVLYMGYSIHGNEASGSNASLMVMYYLAAAQGPEIEELLSNSVILLDPSLNPDGLGRFASWVNVHKNTGKLTIDPNDREYNEVWPGGRTNHYWFDLNRDWLPVQHPESQGRIAKFHEWKPNILTDYHEMGTSSTFFFQPGIPSRTHPLTPERNQLLTAAIAEYHADALDELQNLYFTEESFDDYYYGKGSTYPDVNGAIGILFEQASARGHAQESDNGTLTFPFAIRNQVTASLSTFRAAINLREDLLAHQRAFYKEAAEEAADAPIKGYVFGDANDKYRSWHLAELISRHDIDIYKLDKALTVNGERFEPGSAYVVPTGQDQYKLITAMFERRNTFKDSLFYDVSAWTLPYAFNLPFAELSSRQFRDDLKGEEFNREQMPKGNLIGGRSDYAYIFEWDEYYAPRAAYRLLEKGVRVRVGSNPFTAVTANGTRDFDYGSIMIPLGIQDDAEAVHDIINEIVEEDGITVYSVSTGLTPAGSDLGSRTFDALRKPSVAIIGGDGASSYEVGEAWHLFDTRYHIPVTILDTDDLPRADLQRYNVIVMANGSYGSLSDGTTQDIKDWVADGGVLITYKNALRWAKQQGLAKVNYVLSEDDADSDDEETLPYYRRSNDAGAQVIGGAIFNAELDLSHPIAYGFNDKEMTLFRNSTLFIEKGRNPYSTPVYYTEQPLASGYISDENTEKLAGSGAVVISRFGGGRVIGMTDNPNFRAFWYGTNKLFANAVFFGHTISSQSAN